LRVCILRYRFFREEVTGKIRYHFDKILFYLMSNMVDLFLQHLNYLHLTMALPSSSQSMRYMGDGDISVPILLLALLDMMILPLPAFLLDAFFSFYIALSIVVLLVAVYTHRPLDFAVFPTILLVATLLRLALNVASTRIVLLKG